MIAHRRRSIWPFIGALVFLFLLSIAAPRSWQIAAPSPRIEPKIDETSWLMFDESFVLTLEPEFVDSVLFDPVAVEPRLPETPPQTTVLPQTMELAIPTVVESTPTVAPVVEMAPHPDFAELIRLISTDVPTTPPSYPPTAEYLSANEPRDEVSPSLVAAALAADPAPQPGQIEFWPRAESLIVSLESLRDNTDCAGWADRMSALLEALHQTKLQDFDASQTRLNRLRDGEQGLAALVDTLDDEAMQSRLRHTGYSLVRRLDLWEPIHKILRQQAEQAKHSSAPLRASRMQVDIVALDELLADIERFESTHSSRDAEKIAKVIHRFVETGDPRYKPFALPLRLHYRNANARLAVTAALLNRWMPRPEPVSAEINSSIGAADTWGTSHTTAKLEVRLKPHPSQFDVVLAAVGSVTSETTSDAGNAQFYSEGITDYTISKKIIVNRQGVQFGETRSYATSDSQLTGLNTNMDGVPLLGGFARSYARSQYYEHQGNAQWEAEQRVAENGKLRFDQRIGPKLDEFEQMLQQSLLAPLENMGLAPHALAMSTTKKRLVGRFRIADEDQLSAFTPRPRAPSDSLFSMQIHDSALNNLLSGFDLAGRTMSFRDVFLHVNEKLEREIDGDLKDIPTSVKLTFAEHDPVRVRFDEGKMQLSLHFSEVRRGSKNWKDVFVDADYLPSGDERAADLVRTGSIRIRGGRKGTGRVLALRMIFSKVISKNRPLHLIPAKFVENEALPDLEITQFYISEGWVGVALGPKLGDADEVGRQPRWRTAHRPN